MDFGRKHPASEMLPQYFALRHVRRPQPACPRCEPMPMAAISTFLDKEIYKWSGRCESVQPQVEVTPVPSRACRRTRERRGPNDPAQKYMLGQPGYPA